MAYLALARKWRPKTFSEVVGQTHVVQALTNALNTGRVHHAFLFTGTRGVGKTTLARIFAKSLNCEQGSSAEPCQECGTCQSIDEGRYVDLIEVDAASRTKVDDTRELLENVQYAPTSGKYKVYLIDEVHMLSGHSFNALLKTLEEPPEHVKFLFATTDPQKLPVTVLSRCLQFNLRAMRPEQVENQLVKILNNESLEFDQVALAAIAKAADGSMRDGLSLLDQAIAQSGGAVRNADVESMLGTINASHIDGIMQALADKDIAHIMQVILDMADNAVDFSNAMDELLTQLYYLSLAQLAPKSLASLDVNQGLIIRLSEIINPETVQLYYQIALLGKRDISLAPSLRVGFEMALLRMIAFEPNSSDKELAPSTHKIQPNAPEVPVGNALSQALKTNNSSNGVTKKLNIEPNSAVLPEADVATQANTPQANTPQTNTPQTNTPQAFPHHPHEQRQANNQTFAMVEPIETSSAVPTAIAVTLSGNNEWGELVEQTQLIGLSKELAMHCACEKLSDDKVMLSLSPTSQHLFKVERVSEIQAALQALMNKPQLEVILEVEESENETPAECLQRLGHEQLEQTKSSIKNDPGVKALMSEFGATINEQSIKPT